MKKIGKMNEAAWILGIVLCALGVCLCTKAGFGLSMIAAPAYILHVKLVELSPFFTQGACEYLWQGFLLLIMCLGIQRFRGQYLLAFVTGVLFGLAVDAWFWVLGGNGICEAMAIRIVLFALGESITTLSIAFFFRTSLPLEIYERIVVEFSRRYTVAADKMKLIFDVAMLVLSLAMAWFLNHSFQGIGIGTVIITAVNALLIGWFGKLLDRIFTFEPRFPKLVSILNGP